MEIVIDLLVTLCSALKCFSYKVRTCNFGAGWIVTVSLQESSQMALLESESFP
jgi:hypothetical protein